MSKNSVSVRIELTDKALRDALTTAVESGIAYWANQCNGNDVDYSEDASADAYGVAAERSDPCRT